LLTKKMGVAKPKAPKKQAAISNRLLTIQVQPGSKQNQILGMRDGTPKIALKAKAIDGEANLALIAFLAEVCDTSKASIKILSGQTSRIKRLSLPSAAFERFMAQGANQGVVSGKVPRTVSSSTQKIP
jgi:uncharacterized protein (TIGR00251 family)